jgi:putative spermidine/putrescine transport system substrate-binding protein
MKKSFTLLALVGLTLISAACAAPTPAAKGPPLPTSIGKGEGEVDIVAWVSYIERGDSDPKYDWVTQFEKDTGCKVNVKIAATSDEMVTLMNQGGYDLVTASGDASLRLVYGGTVQPINIDLISNYKNVDPRLANGAWHTVDRDGAGTPQHFGTPYQWGPNVLMYNTDVFKTPPDSWSVVFEEQKLADGKSNKGRVEAYAGPIYIADAALYLKSKDPSLGITDPYALNQKQFDAAIALLKQQNSLLFRYWQDSTVQIDDFTKEGVVASTSWPYQVGALQLAKAPISSVVPKEGATGWADTTMLATASKHPNCSYMWMQHSLEPKVQGDVASWFGSVPAVPAACTGNDLLGPDGCKTNGIDNFDKIALWKTPTSDCFGSAPQGSCVPYDQWVAQYTAIIGAAK